VNTYVCLAKIFLEWEMVQAKVVDKKNNFGPIFLFFENRTVYEIVEECGIYSLTCYRIQ
jgi:hypothetical protein